MGREYTLLKLSEFGRTDNATWEARESIGSLFFRLRENVQYQRQKCATEAGRIPQPGHAKRPRIEGEDPKWGLILAVSPPKA